VFDFSTTLIQAGFPSASRERARSIAAVTTAVPLNHWPARRRIARRLCQQPFSLYAGIDRRNDRDLNYAPRSPPPCLIRTSNNPRHASRSRTRSGRPISFGIAVLGIMIVVAVAAVAFVRRRV